MMSSLPEIITYLTFLSPIIVTGNLIGSSGSHFFLSISQYLVSNTSSSVAMAGRLNNSRWVHPFAIFSSKYPHKSSSCVLCIIIIILSTAGSNNLLGTVFSNRLFTHTLTTSLFSASFGFIGSSIINILHLLPVIDQSNHVA